MAATKKTNASKAPKGSKAACEAAGWKFAPLASILNMPSTYNGHTTYTRIRNEGSRGTMAIPPAGSGIEPRQFGGSLRAVAWAVEQLGQVAKQPDDVPAGMEGVRLLLSAALASGEVCAGDDEAPTRPDALLLGVCRDALAADRAEDAARGRQPRASDDNSFRHALGGAIKEKARAAEVLPELHATTREGLLQKARAALVLTGSLQVTGTTSTEIFKSLAVDLIHLVPTLIDTQGRSIVPPDADAENVA